MSPGCDDEGVSIRVDVDADSRIVTFGGEFEVTFESLYELTDKLREFDARKKAGPLPLCKKCRRHKQPNGRSAPTEMGNSLCHPEECSDYYEEPNPSLYWPGEMMP
jgi:hypothetical protein